MGSTFVEIPSSKKGGDKDSFGKSLNSQVFLQFVPGVVGSTCTNIFDPTYQGDEKKINSILAMPHTGDMGTIKRISMLGEENRYFPLLRTQHDVPTPGDPVLLCTFGKQKYYLGPLNTDNDVNTNSDPLINEQTIDFGKGTLEKTRLSNRQPGYFPLSVRRLHKNPNPQLDFPENFGDPDFMSLSTTPDLIFEGRHGNSIRIGSRNVHPYMMISNGRTVTNPFEQSLDGTIISMTQTGSIRQHFQLDAIEYENPDDAETVENIPQGVEDNVRRNKKYLFTLADDEVGTVHRSISKTFTKAVGRGQTEAGEDDPDVNETIYNYRKPQFLLSSDRITFNAREDSIFMASKQFMHFGSGNTMTFSTSNNLYFESATSAITDTPLFKVYSQQVVIDGRESIVLGHPQLDNGIVKSAVRGEYLLNALNQIVDDMMGLANATIKGIEGQPGATGAAISIINTAKNDIEATKDLINLKNTILSDKVKLK